MNTVPTLPGSEPELATNPSPLTSHRRTGKVARFPKDVRDKINAMLQDGLPYLQIIEQLGPIGQGLTENNLSQWKKGGFGDWVRKNDILDAIERKHELAQDIVTRAADGNHAGRAILQAMATNLCEFLSETDPVILRENLLSDADKFTRFVNAMVRLAEGGIKCELHGFTVQDRTAQAEKQNRPARQLGISPEVLAEAERRLKLL